MKKQSRKRHHAPSGMLKHTKNPETYTERLLYCRAGNVEVK